MAKPRSRPQFSMDAAYQSDDLAGIGAAHWSRLFYEQVFLALDDEDFADLYEEGARCPVSPRLLACVTLLQRMFGVSDRMAVENTIMRRDWRIALGIESDWEGFDASVVCRFRQRLTAACADRRLFEVSVERMEAAGLLKGRGRVRLDATRLVADVAQLVRCCGLRRSRFRGEDGRRLHALVSAAAVNVRRPSNHNRSNPCAYR